MTSPPDAKRPPGQGATGSNNRLDWRYSKPTVANDPPADHRDYVAAVLADVERGELEDGRPMSDRRMNAAEVTATTRAVVQVQGCACDLELEVLDAGEGMFHVTAHHDDWCPLLQAKRRGWN